MAVGGAHLAALPFVCRERRRTRKFCRTIDGGGGGGSATAKRLRQTGRSSRSDGGVAPRKTRTVVLVIRESHGWLAECAGERAVLRRPKLAPSRPITHVSDNNHNNSLTRPRVRRLAGRRGTQ
jgi:hypothetical protein